MIFLEWSCNQKCHIDDADRLCMKNLQAVVRGNFQPDYRPVGIFPTRDAAHEAAILLEEKFPEIFKRKEINNDGKKGAVEGQG